MLNNGVVGLFKMTETPEELEQRYITVFHEAPPLDNFQHGRRKKEWLAVRLLIAGLIGTDFSILYSGEGKPQLFHADYKFISISHSVMYATVYLHKYKKVGIDIESLKRKFVSVEKKYLSEIEQEQVKKYPVLRAVFWSCKEAVFKWAGREGVDFRKQIKIDELDPDRTNTINAVFADHTDQSIKLNFLIFDGHVLVYTR